MLKRKERTKGIKTACDQEHHTQGQCEAHGREPRAAPSKHAVLHSGTPTRHGRGGPPHPSHFRTGNLYSLSNLGF